MPSSTEISSKIPLLIQQQTHLDQACDAIGEHSQIAIDTEFVRTKTYAPHLGLLQITAGELTVCIDPLADLDMGRLWDLLFDPKRMSILHSGKQDMEVMWFERGTVITNLMDTQICAGLLGHPAQIGYAGLAAELLNVDISKDQTRTDWSRRPLTDAQLRYAAEDVVHLPKLHELLKQQLIDKGRYEWALEDSAALSDISLYKPDPESAWRRVKSIPYIPSEQQARARALSEWRENRAVELDKPRQWILADKTLLQIADANPADAAALERLSEVPPPVARKQGRKLLSILAAANAAFARGEVSYQQQIPDRDLDKALSKKLTGFVREQAEQLGFAAEILASKRDIHALLRGNTNSRVTTGWRKTIIGDQLIAELAS